MEQLLTEAEVAKHAGAESCWVVIHGQVYDVTEFAKEHPGGKQILLANGGADVTALFDQLHAPSVLESVAAKFRLGALGEVAQPLAPAAPAGQPTAATPATAGEPEELLNWRISSRATDPLSPPLVPPLGPLAQAHHHAVRAQRSRTTSSTIPAWRRRGSSGRRPRSSRATTPTPRTSSCAPTYGPSCVPALLLGPRPQKRRTAHLPAEALRAHAARAGRQDLGSDWLHVSSPAVYAYQMSIRKRLLEECPELVLISDPQTLPAQAELLRLMLDWLCRRYPARFAVDWGAGVAQTLTEGYRHTFRLADFAGCPVRLCAMLVQEELALMREEPCEPGSEADEREGGIGLQHRFVAGCSCAATPPPPLPVLHSRPLSCMSAGGLRFRDSTASQSGLDRSPKHAPAYRARACRCFSFDLAKKKDMIMSQIHHPHVPGFQAHLQHSMVRLKDFLCTLERARLQNQNSFFWFQQTRKILFLFSTDAILRRARAGAGGLPLAIQLRVQHARAHR